METVTAKEIGERIFRFQKKMEETGVDLSFITHNADLFYFTGSIQQGIFLVPKVGKARYFVRRYYDRAKIESPLKEIVKITSPDDIPSFLGKDIPSPHVIGFALDVLPVNLFRRLSSIVEDAKVKDITPLIREVRSIKSPRELDILRVSGKKLSSLMTKAGEILEEGKSEREIVAELSRISLNKGHSGMIRVRNRSQEFPLLHVLAGPSAAVGAYTDTPLGGAGNDTSLPVGPGRGVIEKGVPVMVDMMWVEKGYITDMSRVFSVGKMKDQQLLKAHHVSIQVLKETVSLIKEGKGSIDIYTRGVEIASMSGLEDNFMGTPGNNVVFIGHGIGLEVDEYPFFARGITFTLEKGMTFALEPKFVFPGRGAVGVENSYALTENGVETLTEMEDEIIVV